MKTLSCLLFVFAALPGFAQRVNPNEAKKKMDAKYGFREVRFEADTTTISGLQRAFKTGVTVYYRRPADNLTVGTATLASIYYGFVEGKLAEVLLETKGFENTNAVREAFQAEFGEGCSVCGGRGDYYWGSDKERITIDVDTANGDASIMIVSKPMLKATAVATKKAGKKAASDL